VQRGRTPLSIRSWRDIPAVPITAFKDLTLSCTPPEEAQRVFMTSGTTRNVRGRSYHPTLAVWNASMIPNFRQRFMQGRDRIRMGILFPDEQALPNSSLAHYLAVALHEFGTADSEVLIGSAGLDMDRLLAALAQRRGERRALCPARRQLQLRASARRIAAPGPPLRCRRAAASSTPAASRASRASSPPTSSMTASVGRARYPRSACINMYGMTELSTQFYDDGNETCPSLKSGPHWIRSRVVDPHHRQGRARGTTGVLVHHDLAHFNSVSAILTEDAGIIVPGGFRLLGRVDGADSKGCSVAVEEFLKAARG
jgi:hypothetical protein